ncbi:hypothetical protein NEISICOT_02639 [Neisseria sicca ATCC 29256]|uniref:Uncharacterized protein n=1 Tax=Neisseria sicca ATCC 29256 TaxID=547045 RepID=C6M7X4_NEISI|nr:hypothetical protein NEISICOT_02639 [Neisseria sicca ATCC 29256]
MLKLVRQGEATPYWFQPPSGGCVLKPVVPVPVVPVPVQPPSGGCVLKHLDFTYQTRHFPAAFGRLCVETGHQAVVWRRTKPAAFGRLCVETIDANLPPRVYESQPPSGGCVLKLLW